MPPAAETDRPVLLVGSAPPRSAEVVLQEAGTRLGSLAPCLPDGDQAGWISAVFMTYVGHPQLEQIDARSMDADGVFMTPVYRLRAGVGAKDLKFGPFGFAATAERSYEVFKRLRGEGKIAAGTRFQTSMPSPLISVMCIDHPYEELLPAIEKALLSEVEGILAAVPADDLAIQWDVCEPIFEEKIRRPDHPFAPFHKQMAYTPTMSQAFESLKHVSDSIPPAAQLGFHLCYGSAGGVHSIEPLDTGLLVEFMNGLSASVARRVDWIHIPVPIERDDAAYFAPLKGLSLKPDTRLYLGLIHQEDGVDGARRRIAAARSVLPGFGVATECGLRQIPDDYAFTDVLDLHRAVATAR